MLRCVGRYKFGHDFYRESVGPMPIWMHKPACLGDEVWRARVGEARARGMLAAGESGCVLRSQDLFILDGLRIPRAELLLSQPSLWPRQGL